MKIVTCLMYNSCLAPSWCLQSELSVQFDDLFKKAWEEDVAELDKDGTHRSNYVLFICADICKVVVSWAKKYEST